MKNVSAFSEFDVSKENSDPGGDMSLGRYLQPALGDESVCSQPLSDSEEEEEEELPLNAQVASEHLEVSAKLHLFRMSSPRRTRSSFWPLPPYQTL